MFCHYDFIHILSLYTNIVNIRTTTITNVASHVTDGLGLQNQWLFLEIFIPLIYILYFFT